MPIFTITINVEDDTVHASISNGREVEERDITIDSPIEINLAGTVEVFITIPSNEDQSVPDGVTIN